MAESKAEAGSDRFSQWLGYWLSRPVGKLAATVILWLLLAGCVQWDEHVRATGRKSLPIAPNREDFLLSLQFGAAIGLVAFLADVLHSLCLAFARLLRSPRERPRPGRSRVNLGAVWTNGAGVVCFVLFAALTVWCLLHEVLPVPAWIAALAVTVPGILLLDAIFGAEPARAEN